MRKSKIYLPERVLAIGAGPVASRGRRVCGATLTARDRIPATYSLRDFVAASWSRNRLQSEC